MFVGIRSTPCDLFTFILLILLANSYCGYNNCPNICDLGPLNVLLVNAMNW